MTDGSGRPADDLVADLRQRLDAVRSRLDDVEREVGGVRSALAASAALPDADESQGGPVTRIVPDDPEAVEVRIVPEASGEVPEVPEVLRDERSPWHGGSRAVDGRAAVAPSTAASPTAPPPDRPAAPARRRVPVVGPLVALVAGLAVVAALLTLTGRGDEGAAPRPDGSRTAAPSSGAPTPAGSRPGVDAAGTSVEVTADGSALTVRESVVAYGGSVRLEQADPAALPSSRVRRPVVAALTAQVEGSPVAVRRVAGGWEVDAPATGRPRIDLRYTLAGAVERRPDGSRALVVVTPLSAAASRAAGAPVVVRMAGARVLQAACLGAPVDDQLCGSAGPDGWVARIPATSPVPFVLLQVDLGG